MGTKWFKHGGIFPRKIMKHFSTGELLISGGITKRELFLLVITHKLVGVAKDDEVAERAMSIANSICSEIVFEDSDDANEED